MINSLSLRDKGREREWTSEAMEQGAKFLWTFQEFFIYFLFIIIIFFHKNDL